jgi:hypothetical protein
VIANGETLKRGAAANAKFFTRRRRLIVGIAIFAAVWYALGAVSVSRTDEREFYTGSLTRTVFIDGKPSAPGRICSRRYGDVFVAPAAGAALCWRVLAERPDLLYKDSGRPRTASEPLRFVLEIEGQAPIPFALDEPSAWKELVAPLNVTSGQSVRWTITVERLFRTSRWSAAATPCFSYGFTLERDAPKVMTTAQLEQWRALEKKDESGS